MKYLDANIVYPMFGVSLKRLQKFNKYGTSGSKIIDYCLALLNDVDKGKHFIILSDLSVLETIGVASRDIGVQKAKLILKAIQTQIHLEVIQTSQTAWATALSLTINTIIEARDSLHLANALLTDVVTSLVTCDEDFAEKAKAFLEENIHQFNIPMDLQHWYQFSPKITDTIEEKIKKRSPQITIELVEL